MTKGWSINGSPTPPHLIKADPRSSGSIMSITTRRHIPQTLILVLKSLRVMNRRSEATCASLSNYRTTIRLTRLAARSHSPWLIST